MDAAKRKRIESENQFCRSHVPPQSQACNFGIIAVKRMTGVASKIPQARKDIGDPTA
jgi:hypothetical protein